MKDLKVTIIGCGNMGSAISQGIVAGKILKPSSVFLYDKISEKAKSLAKKTGCAYKGLPQAINDADILIVAIKPQDFENLFSLISKEIAGKTIASVMAGISIKTIASKVSPKTPIARIMPNIAAFMGESISVLSFNRQVVLKKELNSIFSGIGKVMELKEAFMNKVTAVSGSGPAYLFYLAEAMIEAGKEPGLNEAKVKELVVQTLYGAALMLKETKELPGVLINKVASKGGTTEAALAVFRENDLKSVIKKAVKKAEKRAKELSSGE